MDVDAPNDSTISENERTIINEAEERFKIPPPPLTAFVANADGSRLIITEIVNENFKSYAGVQKLGPFSKYFTAILGPNGSGKSNVIDSLLFVFGTRSTRIRSANISALLHDSQEYGRKDSCTVTVHFCLMKDIKDDDTNYEVVPGSEFTISRTAARNNSSFYCINGQKATFAQLREKLQRNGIDLVHNRFLILQGEVEQISLMKPKGDDKETGMLEYLEDVIGSSRFKQPIEECAVELAKLNEVREIKKDSCSLACTAMNDLEAPKTAAENYLHIENAIVKLNNQLIQKKIAMGEVDKNVAAENLSKAEASMSELKAGLADAKKQQQALEKQHEDKLQELERMSAHKERMKAEFDERKQRDVTIRQEIERSNKRRKDLAKRKKDEEEKRIALEKVPMQSQETINDLEVREKQLEEERQVAERKHAEVLASLKEDTVGLQKEKEVLQTEQAELMRAVNSAKAKHGVASTELSLYTSRQDGEQNKLADLQKRLDDIASGVDARNEESEKRKKEVSKREKLVKQDQEEVSRLRVEERKAEEERRKQQITVEEARSSMQSNKSRGKVLDALMRAKQSGQLPGVFGRMGDLGGIDEKYDVAISTAAGALEHIVVDTVDTAEACIMFLKKNDIGRASFVALDKQEHYRQVYERPFRAPENVSRLFDLIRVDDDRIRPAFYFALHDTLVAKDLEQASRIAYGATRYRVVTLKGELIEIAGTMSGGGKQVLRGRMGRKASEKTTDGVPPKEMENMERNLEQLTSRLTDIRKKIMTLEEQIATNSSELNKSQQALSKLLGEIKACTTQEPALRNQIKAQEAKVQQITLDPAQVSKLKKDVEAAQKELDKATEAAKIVEEKVNKVHAEIVAKTKGRVEVAQKKLDEITKSLDKARAEKTKLRVAVTTAARNLTKCEEKIVNMQKEIESCEQRMRDNAAEHQRNEEEAKKELEVFEKIDEKLSTLQSNNKEYKLEHDKLVKKETELKSREIDLKEELGRCRAEHEAQLGKIAAYKKKLKSLKLSEIPKPEELPDRDEETLEQYSAEELEKFSVENIFEQIKHVEETLPKKRPDVRAISDYFRARTNFLAKQKDLDAATEECEKYRSMLKGMKEARLSEFKGGFQVISLQVRECYQMLAEGGDAELELINTIDPFLDGIKFTVRPPKKSWKEIQFLSGGEKTLSSLALIFALHHYKPTPIYFMDEIDSALDFKNTTIVGNYIKHQTKNAQFIVVSLRENMFEIAHRLVGIYKTDNCTKSTNANLHKFKEVYKKALKTAGPSEAPHTLAT